MNPRRLAGALLLMTAGWAACGPSGSDAERSPERPSVLLIVVDTLRADHLGTYGYERATSPAIDAWATRGTVFEAAQSTSSWTLPAMASLFSGWLPSRHGSGVQRNENGGFVERDGQRVIHRFSPEIPTLPEVLRRSGYRTGAVVTNDFLRRSFGLARGFDSYEHLGQARGRRVVDAALAWLDAHGSDESDAAPFFLFAHFFDPHLPYIPAATVKGTFRGDLTSSVELTIEGLQAVRASADSLSETDKAFVTAAYDEDVLSLDAQLGRLLRGLDERGLTEKTIVILTSDHGEELFEHGGFEHGHTMFQELLAVPLIVVGPGIEPRRSADPVSLAEVPAFLYEHLGVPPPPGLEGGALVGGQAGYDGPLISEGNLYGVPQRALLEWPYKYVEGEAPRVFDLAQDPTESHPLVDPELERRLARALSERLARERARAVDAAAAEIDEDVLHNLRGLGYLGEE